MAIALFVAAAQIKISWSLKLPPKTYIYGEDLSYKTREESLKILEQKKEKYLNSEVKITFGDKSAMFKPKDLGVEILTDKTLEIVWEAKKKNTSILEWIFAKDKKIENIDPLVYIDYEKLFKKLDETLQITKTAPKPATFYFDERGKLAIKDGEKGFVFDSDKIVSDLKISAKSVSANEIKIISKEQNSSVTKEILEKKRTEIGQKLNHKFILMDPIYSDDWEVKLEDHLDWVTFVQKQEVTFADILKISNRKNTEPQIAIEINQDRLNEFVDEEISKWLDVPAEEVNISFDENKKVIISGGGNDGKKVERKHLKKAIELAVENFIRDVPIPVITISPKINITKELQDLGIKERLSIGHTSYYGSPANRIHNIKTAAANFNGVLIEPDEIFSFNKTLGPVDAGTGYRQELVIKSDGTIPEYGGGVCQVSTTTYRAALFAGLPIVERNQHTYAVSYYSQILGHGLDATIYLGGPNLRFKNDTSKHILMQMYVKEDYELYVVLYGTFDDRTVKMEGPYLSNYHSPGPTQYIETPDLPVGETKQVEKAHTGFNALWYRYLTHKDGQTDVEEIFTHYQAIPAKIMVGVGTSPAP